MKKIVVLLVMALAFAKGNAQLLNPVKWTTQIEKKSEGNYALTFNGVIDTGWHLYSQFTPEGGSLPLEVLFKNQKGNFELIGKTKESKTKTAYNDIFEVNETFFEKKAQLTQEIHLINPKLAKVEVSLNYQVCKDACINLEKNFTFVIPSQSKEVENVVSVQDSAKTTAVVASDEVVNKENSATVQSTATTPVTEPEKGLLSIFIIAFFSGFAALLTPCVFPMIPMTVSFFTKQSKSKGAGVRNAIFYGVSIIVIYVLLGVLVTWLFGADALNALSTNVWFNLFFFILLVVFAASFLGAFEIMLPNSWANKVDSQADRGGMIGILFMALALAIVSFSCTGPIVGTLLVQAASKGGIAPIVGMLGFSLALALPFMLFALFPGWLNSLPKSGGWLNTVKVV